jgi:hypothetical protein
VPPLAIPRIRIVHPVPLLPCCCVRRARFLRPLSASPLLEDGARETQSRAEGEQGTRGEHTEGEGCAVRVVLRMTDVLCRCAPLALCPPCTQSDRTQPVRSWEEDVLA